MTPFKVAHAAAEHWAHAAQGCAARLVPLPEGANFGFLYVTDYLAGDMRGILNYMQKRTGIRDWVGTVGMGVCAGDMEYQDVPAIAAMVGTLPENSFRVFTSLSNPGDDFPTACSDWIDDRAPPFAIVHGDPANPNTTGLVETVAGRISGFLVGGLTSSRGANHQVAGRVTGGGVSGALFAPEVEVATGLSQGCAPIGPPRVISDCLDNVIIGLDGKPALEVFKGDIGELLARDMNRALGYVHAALMIEGADTGDYLVRDLMGVDQGRGWMHIGAHVRPGDRVMFVRRDPQSARQDMTDMLTKLKARLPGEPRGGVYFSCVARGANMFGELGVEMDILRRTLGEVPILGFYAGGEISNDRLYGYTGVVALFL